MVRCGGGRFIGPGLEITRVGDAVNADIRPRRSVLYVPGSNARAIDKARGLDADGVIFDLEDAVAPAAKPAARQAVVDAVGSGGYGHRELVVRVNAHDTPWHDDDIAAAAVSGADGVLLPKVSSVSQVTDAAKRLATGGAPPGLRLWIMAETPACIQNIDAIAVAHDRLAVIVMGNEDLAAAMRLAPGADRAGLKAPMSRCVVAARAAGLDILDGVYTELKDIDGLRAVCGQGRALGFDGKTLIHPAQIGVANDVFGVTADEVSRARAIVSAWEAGPADGPGIIVVDGQMIERLHVEAARRVIALDRATTRTQDSPET